MPPDISIQKNNINSEVNRQQVPLSAASSTHTHTHTHTYTPPDTSIEYGRIHYKKKKISAPQSMTTWRACRLMKV